MKGVLFFCFAAALFFDVSYTFYYRGKNKKNALAPISMRCVPSQFLFDAIIVYLTLLLVKGDDQLVFFMFVNKTFEVARHGYDSFFRFNSVSESFHLTQLMTLNGFTRIDSNRLTTENGFMKFDSNRLTNQKASRIFGFKSTRDSKKLSRNLIQIDL